MYIHVSLRVFISVAVSLRTPNGLEYQYQQCIKYKPGSNSNIQDKVDLRSYFEQAKKLFETIILVGGRFLWKI